MTLVLLVPTSAGAQEWSGATAAGGDLALLPEVGGHGFALFDAVGRDVVGDGDLHFLFHTDTLEAGIERVPLADGRVTVGLAARGEFLFAGILRDYYERGDRIADRGFNASYLAFVPKLQWHVAGRHTLEVTTTVRRWWFGPSDATAPDLVLPAEAWVFEPRLGYIFWKIDAPSEEWEAHRLFPRITGFAFGVWVGLDVRTDARPWGAVIDGALDPRNDPGRAILTVRQMFRAGFEAGPLVRIQIEESASWGEGEDDLSRNRAGGMTPYVVPIAGLPWPALLCERLLAGQLSLHLRLGRESDQELGLLVGGGAFNDIERDGDLRSFGGAGGAAIFSDLRFGPVQIHLRFGASFPADWQADPPHLSMFAALGSRLF
jgi:hypothetical protein